MNEAEVNALLEQLGLTEYEAKTLTALFKLRESEAPEVSRIAQVPKTRVYDVLDRLTKRKLVIEIYGRPKKYRVVDAETVFGELISQKKSEISELEQKANQVKELLSITNGGDEASERVMKVKDKFDFMRILAQEIDQAKEQVVAFTGLDREHAHLRDAIKNAAKKNVKVKLISKIPNEVRKLAKEYSEAGVDLRELEHGMHAYLIDGKKVILALSDFAQDRPEYHFTIWNNNKPMATALNHYFDACWSKATQPKH
ncbi:MAG: TrmB family transcriptional regulator [Candidatus Diapherotrites archaeon]|uniref:TrmB family transcriptional regulator n=1 Tax=Candidatus Iainarchaeum sp. TaxID=3101447 RepID=A0A8T4L874_9ARCH|nr:TrmB family transcriptional regulator [Candidatus Diapherotrites archaeon]